MAADRFWLAHAVEAGVSLILFGLRWPTKRAMAAAQASSQGA
ncbi:hypothetical protein [Brevundimonas sp.]